MHKLVSMLFGISIGHVQIRLRFVMALLVESKADSSDEDRDADKLTSTQLAATIQLPKVTMQFTDEPYKLFLQIQVDEPTPDEARTIRNKYIKWILPIIYLLWILYHVY